MAVTCVYALMFTSLRDKAEEIQGKILCQGHILIWQNLQEHGWDWLETRVLCLLFIVLIYVTVKLSGESGKSKVQIPAARQGPSSSSLGRKNEKSSSEEDYMYPTLTLLKIYLVNFLSSVRNLKLTTSTNGNHNPLSVEVPADLWALGQWRIWQSGFISQSRRGIVDHWHTLSNPIKWHSFRFHPFLLYDLIVQFILLLNNILLCWCTIVCLSSRLLKDTLVASNLFVCQRVIVWIKLL